MGRDRNRREFELSAEHHHFEFIASEIQKIVLSIASTERTLFHPSPHFVAGLPLARYNVGNFKPTQRKIRAEHSIGRTNFA